MPRPRAEVTNCMESKKEWFGFMNFQFSPLFLGSDWPFVDKWSINYYQYWQKPGLGLTILLEVLENL